MQSRGTRISGKAQFVRRGRIRALFLVLWSTTLLHQHPFLSLDHAVGAATADSGSNSSSTDSNSSSDSEQPSFSSFLWLSDIHLDPYYGTDQATNHPFCGSRSYTNSSEGGSSSGTEDNRTTHQLQYPYGRMGCDAPMSLFQSALDEIQRQFLVDNESTLSPSSLDFVIITGDLVRHGNNQVIDEAASPSAIDETKNILRQVSTTLVEKLVMSSGHKNQETLPITIVPALGNNDVTPDYYLDIHNATALLDMVTDGMEPLLQTSASSTLGGMENDLTIIRSTLQKGGYAAVQVTPQITILSLNTILYSTNHLPPTPSGSWHSDNGDVDDSDPLDQFQWLQTQLLTLAGSNRKVFIIGHIPPTMGSYRHSQLWKEQYLDRYYDIIQPYLDTKLIAGQLFGHLHSDEFRLVHPSTTTAHDDSNEGIPLFLSPSLTPIYGSNPSFRIVKYHPVSGQLFDYDTFYLDLQQLEERSASTSEQGQEDGCTTRTPPSWQKSPSFIDSFQISGMTPPSLQSILSRLTVTENQGKSATVWETMLARHRVYAAQASKSEACWDSKCRREWLCSLTAVDRSQYQACLIVDRSASFQMPWYSAVLILLVSVLVLTITLRATRRKIQRSTYETPANNDTEEELSEEAEMQLPEIS